MLRRQFLFEVILVYLYPFCCNSLFCSQKLPKKSIKNPYFQNSRSIKVINVDNSKKLVTSACYVKQHVCAYLEPFSCQTSQQQINNHYLDGYHSLTPTCAGLLEPRASKLGLLKSTSNAENFICRLSWSIANHLSAIHF